MKGRKQCDKKEEDIAIEKERLEFDDLTYVMGHTVARVTTITSALLIRRCEHATSLCGLLYVDFFRSLMPSVKHRTTREAVLAQPEGRS